MKMEDNAARYQNIGSEKWGTFGKVMHVLGQAEPGGLTLIKTFLVLMSWLERYRHGLNQLDLPVWN